MLIIMSLIIALVTAGCVATAQNMLAREKYDKTNKIGYFTGHYVDHTMIVGMSAGAINYFVAISEGMLWMTPILAIAITALFVLLVREWLREGSSMTEMIPFLILAVIFWTVAKSAFCAMSALFTSLWLARIVEMLPTVFLIITIAVFIVNLLLFKEEISNGKKAYRYVSIAVAIIALIGLGALSVNALGDVDEFANDETAVVYADSNDTQQEVESTYWDGLHFYNDDVRGDSNQDNDYNFGPNPYTDGKDVGYYVEDFESRRSEDPALLSATMLTLDNTVNTDYIGSVLYQGYDEKLNVLERADAATKVLASDKSIFDSNEEAVSAMLDSAKSVKLVKKSKISDQLYMNGYTADGIPQVVIYETDVTSDWCLVYTFKIKTSEVQIAFRIPCGYQWTNPYKLLQKNVTSVSSKSSGSGGGGKGDGPSPSPTPKPSPKPTPSDKYEKDSSKDSASDTGGGGNKPSDGTGDYQATKPSKDSGSNADSSSGSGSSSSSSKGSDPASGSGVTTPIEKHDDSHDSGGSSAGNN